MDATMYAALEKAIQEWMDTQGETPEWEQTTIYVGNRTVEMMATAARAVFDACAESQEYAQREGFIKTVA